MSCKEMQSWHHSSEKDLQLLTAEKLFWVQAGIMKLLLAAYLRKNRCRQADTTDNTTILTMVSFRPSSGADFILTTDPAQTRCRQRDGGRVGRWD